MHYDVFNGDADGIIALLQLRFNEPKASNLVTGVKRDIKLLSQLKNVTDVASVTVLDISMEKNQSDLAGLLEQQCAVFYCDHHRSGDISESEYLEALIDTSPETCTSLLINEKLGGKYIAWAIAAAFGDNLKSVARELAEQHGYDDEQIAFLEELGTLINYNAYGSSLADLHISPVDLYRELYRYPDPFELVNCKDSVFFKLRDTYKLDYNLVSDLSPVYQDSGVRVFELPCEPWARRISGVFGNECANEYPKLAHAVLTKNSEGNAEGESYTVSVRAPLENRIGADEICIKFATGGGRKAAAGINVLKAQDKVRFIEILASFYQVF
ncbi:DHH family phosphoesterase [Photobacterium sp. BZF1]|uniref:DHH family phosphoesterase n=1 Tax=Photobacterium sp. BZF1 TaxID=1904457 RepID=UPI001653B84E|nr:DHH family phosphoesterase [Photobacterium sp. BZF1]MBC7005665.1 DHH family phosphoesterase [Photobacterium sp. BZF1]